MCHSIQQVFSCGHQRPQLERCPLEFLKGHTLDYARRDFDHPCWYCRREQKLRERLEEHRQKIEEQERALEADDESEVKSSGPSHHKHLE